MAMKHLILAAFFLFVGALSGARGAERLKDEYKVREHVVSLKRLEKVMADKLEGVEKVTVLSVEEYPPLLILFDMSIVTSDGQEYQFSDCFLYEHSKSIFSCKSDKATLDEIEFDFAELAPTASKKRFRVKK